MKELVKGIRHLSPEEAKDVDLGPLAQLPGVWVSPAVNQQLIAPGWNVISVPSTPGAFAFEVIPYTEVLTFSPVVISAGNRGPIVNGAQVTQQITGLMYEQSIISACPGNAQCVERGFPAGSEIHAETGLFLNLGDPNGNMTIARLATIPHGNSVLALGTSTTVNNPGSSFFPTSSSLPFNLDGSPVSALLDYDIIYKNEQFPNIFDQVNPNSFLQKFLGNSVITDMTVLQLSTTNQNAGGGILNIPFIATNVNATTLDATFWIETIQGSSQPQLQYSQTINLVFPPSNTATPIVWPHITISTLVKRV